MTLSQRLEKIKENWIAIIISLVAATFLYFYYQINQLQTTSLYVPLTVESDGSLLLVNNLPQTVKITVKGKQEEISKISDRDITAYLNLNYFYEPGKYNVPINLKLSTVAERMNPLEIKIKPESMDLQLEKKTIEYVPVSPQLIGTVASGYEISNIEVEPKNVRIVGPYSAVTHTTEIETNAVDISNITEDTEFDSYFVNKNKLISIDEENSCTVKVNISEIIENKTFENIDITLLNPGQDLEATYTVKKANITVKGTQNYLANYKLPYGVLYVDCSAITEPGEYNLEIKTHKLNNLTPVSIEPKNIAITITEKPIEPVNEETETLENQEEINNQESSENESQENLTNENA